ncbi:MAG: lipid-A-disaccharide synthase [Muribaculaceae bacterium]|nr:lipid-A-disaccharide synthase [Muribaculaceae bacterium]
MTYFLSVGEASGDIHAAELIKELKAIDENAEFVYLGGDLMREAAGCDPVVDYRDMAYMGFSEVLRNLDKVFGNLRRAKDALRQSCPDALILVDYPSFNLKLAKAAHQLGIPVFYYISPKVWAWKEYRVKQIKKYVTRLFSILPFEVEFFKKHDYEVTYVGNPSVEEIEQRIKLLSTVDDFINAHDLEARPILALVPGSRRGEIRNNLPIMLEAAKRFPQYQAVIAGAPGIDASLYASMTSQPVVTGVTFELMSVSQAALVTSGTATLEAALLRTPQVVCYRANGSKFSYNLFKRILKIPFVSLPNLIAGREIVKEMLLHYCEPEGVAYELSKVIPGGEQHQAQLDGYTHMRSRLGTNKAAETTARLIYETIG